MSKIPKYKSVTPTGQIVYYMKFSEIPQTLPSGTNIYKYQDIVVANSQPELVYEYYICATVKQR